VSEVPGIIKRETGKLKEKVREKIEPKAKKIRVLRIWALGPHDAETLNRWMKDGKMIEELLKENMELRSKYVNLEAKLTVLSDRIAARKLARIFRIAREVVRDEGED